MRASPPPLHASPGSVGSCSRLHTLTHTMPSSGCAQLSHFLGRKLTCNVKCCRCVSGINVRPLIERAASREGGQRFMPQVTQGGAPGEEGGTGGSGSPSRATAPRMAGSGGGGSSSNSSSNSNNAISGESRSGSGSDGSSGFSSDSEWAALEGGFGSGAGSSTGSPLSAAATAQPRGPGAASSSMQHRLQAHFFSRLQVFESESDVSILEFVWGECPRAC